jgi:hypothetical protein
MGSLSPQGKRYSRVRQEALNGLHSVAFLGGHLLRLKGERLLVIGDGSPIHPRAEVKGFLPGAMRGKIHVEALPPTPQTSTRSKGPGNTSSTWRCATECAWTWKSCLWNFIGLLVACGRKDICFSPSLLEPS